MSSNEMSKAKILLAALGAVLFMALAFLYTNYRSQQPEDIIQLSPAEMSERVNELLRNFGFRDRPAERWSEYTYEKAGDHDRVVRFVERQSLDHFQAVIDGMTIEPASGLAPGERRVVLDSKGRLVELSVKFPKTYDSSEPATKFDWNAAFTAAGLDIAAFTPIDTAWTPNAAADSYAAWTGKSPDDPSVLLRVEASTFRGLLTNFLVVFPWNEPEQTRPAAPTTKDRLLISFSLVALAAFLFLSVRLIWSRMAEPAGYVRSALLSALFVFVPVLIGQISTTPQVASFGPLLDRALLATIIAFSSGALAFLIYSATASDLSKYAKPLIASWQQVSSGHWFTRSVGNDVLSGVLFGTLIALVFALIASPGAMPLMSFTEIGRLVVSPFGSTFLNVGWGILCAAVLFGSAGLLIVAFRRQWIANVLLFVLINTLNWFLTGSIDQHVVALALIISFVATRFGMLSTIAMAVVANVSVHAMLALHATATPTIAVTIALVATAILLIVGVVFSVAAKDSNHKNGHA